MLSLSKHLQSWSKVSYKGLSGFYIQFNTVSYINEGTLKTKVDWSNKEKLVDPTLSNLTNQVGYINQVCW